MLIDKYIFVIVVDFHLICIQTYTIQLTHVALKVSCFDLRLLNNRLPIKDNLVFEKL